MGTGTTTAPGRFRRKRMPCRGVQVHYRCARASWEMTWRRTLVSTVVLYGEKRVMKRPTSIGKADEKSGTPKGLRQDGLRRGTRRRRPMPSSLLRLRVWACRLTGRTGLAISGPSSVQEPLWRMCSCSHAQKAGDEDNPIRMN